MERVSAWFGGLTTGMKALVVVASLVLFAVLSPLIGPLAMLVFIVCVPVVAYMMLGGRRYRRPGALLVYALAAALLTGVASSGLYCAPAEQTDSPSSTRNEPKEDKSKETARDEARSTRPKTEAARSTAKENAEQPAAKPEPKPKPKPKPEPNPVKKQEPKSKRSTSGTPSPYDATVTVARVVDGDTVEISPAIRGTEDVRLIGIDTPETVDPGEGVEPYGPQASAFATRELTGRKVGIEFDRGEGRPVRSAPCLRLRERLDVQRGARGEGLRASLPLPAQHDPRGQVRGGAVQGQGFGDRHLGTHRGPAVRTRGPGQRHRRGHARMHGHRQFLRKRHLRLICIGHTTSNGEAPPAARVAPISEDDCPPSAPIKGNQSGLYHVPGGAYYDVTNPEECFATAADAEAAGYEASSR